MGKLTHTVKGPIASFRSADKANIESIKLHFLPKQEGSGDPSPTNVRPVTGWTGCNLFKAKKNIIKPYYTEETSIRGMTVTPTANGVRVQGKASAEHPIRLSSQDVRFLEAGKKYAFSLYINGDISGCKDPYLGYHTGVTYKSIKNLDSSINYSFVWTVPDAYANAPAPWFDMYIRVKENSTVDFEIGLQMEAGENVTAYEPYAGVIIPITFPSNGKNRYYYDEDNIEVGVLLESGLIRTIYHTHAYGNGGKMSISGYPIDPEVVSNTSINVGYLNKDGTVHVSNSFIAYQDGAVTSRSNVVPNGLEFVLIGTGDSDWIFRRNLPRYNFQIEYADSPTTYEPYSSDNTFHGGYIDPVIGELKSEWRTYTFDGTESNLGINYRASSGTGRVLTTFTKNDIMAAVLGGNILCNMLKTTTASHGDNIIFARTLATGCCMDFSRESICNLTIEEFDELTNAEHLALVKTYLANLYANGTPLIIAYKATESVEYDLTPQQIKTFLDYNNFWTDMNDDTEVEYEFADRLSIRKALMVPETRIVNWNQLQKDGNFTDLSNWEITQGYGTLTVSGNIATWTCTNQPTQFYQTGFRIKNGTGYSNFLSIPWNHKIIVMAMVRCSVSSRIRLYGLVGSNGNTYIYQYNYGNANLSANTWTKICGFISNRPETPPASTDDVIIKRFKPTLHGTDGTISTIAVGTTLEMKNFMAFDLTQMFGLGNEPSTVEEFERICQLNGIDLDTYQPYDTGSNKLMIMPM